MRPSTFSSVAILATSLLAREVLAGRYDVRKRDVVIEVVTDSVIVNEEIVVTLQADGTYQTGLPVPVGTTTVDGVPIALTTIPSSPSSTAAPTTSTVPVVPTTSLSSTSSSAAGAVFIEQDQTTETSSTSTQATPTPTSTPTPTPTSFTPEIVAPTTSNPAPVPTTPTTFVTVVSSTLPVATAKTASSGNKRGLAYNDASLLPGFVSSDSEVSWCYNWDSRSATTPTSIEYVPLLWGTQSSFTSVWSSAASAAIAAGSTHLMSFNEPDLSSQSNIEVDTAAKAYIQYMQPFAGKAKLGAPAVTNGASPLGLTWLGNFLSECKGLGCTIDFCAIHWYDSATNIDYFKNYMQEAYATCNNRPIWLTEFGASGTAEQQNTFLQTVLPWLDSQDYIQRYAYFMVDAGSLISTGTTLSALGSTFATFT